MKSLINDIVDPGTSMIMVINEFKINESKQKKNHVLTKSEDNVKIK